MRLTLAKLPGRDGAARIGLVHGNDVLDAHEAHATALALHMDAKRAYELAEALVPSDLYGFVRNGRHGWKALNLALEYLGEAAADRELVSPRRTRVVFRQWEVQPRPMFEGFTRASSSAPRVEPVIYGRGPEAVNRRAFRTGSEYEVELAALIARPGARITDVDAWDHIAGYVRVADGDDAMLLRSPDEIDADGDADVYCELADAVSSVSHEYDLDTGDVVRAGTGRRSVVHEPMIDLTDPYLLEVLLNST